MGTEEEALSAQCAACHSYLSMSAVLACGREGAVQSGSWRCRLRKEEGDGLDSDLGFGEASVGCGW